jgi:hypothetical protein
MAVLGVKTLLNGLVLTPHPTQLMPHLHAALGTVKMACLAAIYALSFVKLPTIRGGMSFVAAVTK